MSELTNEEITTIRNRLFGNYCLNAPSLGPYEAFRMAPGILAVPNLPDWAKEMFTSGKIGFFQKKVPATVGKYWMRGEKKPIVLHQGDWFVKIQDEPLQINRYTPEAFNLMFGAKEMIAPDGFDKPIQRTIEIYSPSAEAATVSGQISAYLETSFDEWMSKAYYHYLEICKDMLLTGPIQNRIPAIQAYTDKLESKGGQIKKTKYFKLLKKCCELLNGEE